MIASSSVFDSVRRGYNELESTSDSEIVNYFDHINPDAMIGHISNIKGIVFEQQITNILNEQGLDAEMHESTNHALSDIALIDDDNEIIAELQLKATDSVSYINETLAQHPDIPIITTSEVARNIDNIMVIDSGIENSALEQLVTEELLDQTIQDTLADTGTELTANVVTDSLAEVVTDIALPVSPLGLAAALFGIPFL